MPLYLMPVSRCLILDLSGVSITTKILRFFFSFVSGDMTFNAHRSSFATNLVLRGSPVKERAALISTILQSL